MSKVWIIPSLFSELVFFAWHSGITCVWNFFTHRTLRRVEFLETNLLIVVFVDKTLSLLLLVMWVLKITLQVLSTHLKVFRPIELKNSNILVKFLLQKIGELDFSIYFTVLVRHLPSANSVTCINKFLQTQHFAYTSLIN